MDILKKTLLIGVVFLTSCSLEDPRYFSLNCNGQLSTVNSRESLISQENRKYEFDENEFKRRNCLIKDSLVVCYKELSNTTNRTTTKEQLIYNIGNYSFTDFKVTVGLNESNNQPVFISNELFQSNCPRTVKRVKKDS